METKLNLIVDNGIINLTDVNEVGLVVKTLLVTVDSWKSVGRISEVLEGEGFRPNIMNIKTNILFSVLMHGIVVHGRKAGVIM